MLRSSLPVAPPRGLNDLLLEGALGMREVPSRRAKAHLPADVVPTFPTLPTFLAGDSRFEGHSVSDMKASHGGTHRRDDSGRLVPEGERLLDQDVAVAEVIVVVQIRTTEPGRLDGHLDVLRGKARERTRFLGRRG